MKYFSIPATLGTGGWLGIARQGLAPCKRRQAALGAPTIKFTCLVDAIKKAHTTDQFHKVRCNFGLEYI